MPSSQQSFTKQASFVVQELIPVEKYKSTRTGLTVCIAQVQGPLVNGYFCIATEAHDDDGLPHTLEHLVFMGSEKYPYKGMLDLFANRCLAQGTNAWTDTDHTCYTMTTAGSEGFLNLLPIYLDHVLYPTLKEAAYITEVHHVNGDGEDAGVVYCEMQARENSGDSRTYLEFLRSMYPGLCGYKSETGGIMKNLRTTCSHEKVCDYHRTFYRPDNLCLIITGQVKVDDIFTAIAPFEEKILSKGSLPSFERPWQNPVPALNESVVKPYPFPTEDESSGMVILGWRGPHVSDYYSNDALKILLNYLTDTPVAPLEQDLVEIEEPFCSDIGYSMLENLETSFFMKIEGVGKEHLEVIKSRVTDVLKKLVSKDIALDMKRIQTLLHRELLECMNALEDQGHDTLAQFCIGDFLYSAKPEKFEEYCNRFARLEKLKLEGDDYWRGLIQAFFLDRSVVVIEGNPSENLMTQMAKEEKDRIAQQRETLGEKGLESKKEVLEKAKDENEVEPPPEIVNSLSVPSTSSICFHDINTISNKKQDCTRKGITFPVQEIPFSFQLDHIKSLFVQINALCDTSFVPEKLRMYLPLYAELLFESPILRDGQIIPYEDVVNQLAADTLETDASLGFGGGRFQAGRFSKLFTVSLKVETSKFDKGIQWLQEVLYKVQFTPERIRIVANKIINDVPSCKRSGRKVVSSLMKDINFTKDSNNYIVNMIRQQNFLSKLLKRLDANSSEVIAELEELRASLTNLQTLRFYVAADSNRLPEKATDIIKSKFAEAISKISGNPRDLCDVAPDYKFLQNKVLSKIVGVGSVESSFLYQSCPSITSYNHPDYAPLLVFIEYLSALEGPLWRQIRGLGLSYHYNIILDPSNGILTFVLFKSTHIVEAYKKAKEIMHGYLSGETSFDESQIEAAISGVIFGVISKEQSVGDAATQSILSEFKGVSPSFSRDVLQKLSKVTVDDLKRVGKTYFTKLFDPEVSSCALCCHPSKVDDIVLEFGK